MNLLLSAFAPAQHLAGLLRAAVFFIQICLRHLYKKHCPFASRSPSANNIYAAVWPVKKQLEQ